MGIRLPGGVRDPAGARALFRAGRDTVAPVPADRMRLPTTTASGRPVPAWSALVDGVDRFDAELFGVAAREAAAMDPQQRLLLEVAWAALEDAGLPPDRQDGARAGVFVGMGLTDWERRTFGSADPARLDPWSGTGTFDSVAAGRIAYTFGLRGPALAVHTACSASLVALHLAIRSLRSGESDLALAGGANLLLAPEPTVYFAEIGALSPSGRCRTFDAEADGYVRGEGVGLFALMRAEDAVARGRRIHGLVLGTATNSDGRTNGLTAPSARAQADVVRDALADAGVSAADIGFLEAHGTGTPLGDPIEIEALASVFGAGERPVHVSSAKTVVGHLEAAAGVAGVARALVALADRHTLPHNHLRVPNPRLPIAGTRLRLPTVQGAFEGLAGVSGFGLSGTNAHVVLGPAPAREEPRRTWPRLVAVSGRTEDAVRERLAAVTPDALQTVGRAALRYRAWRVVRSDDGLADRASWPIHRAGRAPGLVFVCSGQGSQLAGAGRELAEAFPVFRGALAEVDGAYASLVGSSLVAEMVSGRSLDRTALTQPAVFAYGWALTALLHAHGIVPDAWIGHSVGELLAASRAGAIPLPEAVRLVVERARAIDALPPGGAMLATTTLPSELPPGVEVAATNAPGEFVLSGPAAALEGLEGTLLPVSHAFHSPLVEPALGPFAAALGDVRFPAPRERVWSALDGEPLGESDAARWVRHVRAPVRFLDAVRAALADGLDHFVELGARRVLSGNLVRSGAARVFSASPDPAGFLGLLGQLFEAGHRPDLPGDGGGEVAPYPFAPVRHWLEPSAPAGAVRADYAVVDGVVSPEAVPLPADALDPTRPVLVTGGTGHVGRAIVGALRARGAREVVVWARRATDGAESVDLGDPDAIRARWRPEFQGVVHAAGEAWRDGEAERAHAVKAGALRVLDELVGDGFLVAVGSVSAHWPTPGLATYGAANRAMEDVVAARVAAGRRGAVVVLGPVAGGGLVAPEELASFARAGVAAVPVARAAEVVAHATALRGVVGVGRVDWARLAPIAEAAGPLVAFDRVRPPKVRHGPVELLPTVLEVTAEVLGRSPGDLDPSAGFFALGLDSVLAVELAAALRRRLGRAVPDTVAFDHPTPEALAAALSGVMPPPPVATATGDRGPIAVVGWSCRLPGGDSPEAFRAFLASGRDAVGPVPAERWDPAAWPEAPREGGFLPDLAGFDGDPFGIGPVEAEVLDPQQRLLLELGVEALERAAIPWDRLAGARGAVYVGVGRSEYWDRVRDPERAGYVFSGTGNESSFAAGRLAHLLGLRGPAASINTACSSSLVAVHLAVGSLRSGEVDLAVVGGANVLASPEAGTVLRRMGALSPTDRCRTFSADADGYVRGEGAAVLVLKRLADARRDGDRVHAVILGSAVGHDGRSPGLGVPSGEAQQDVLRRALADAGLAPGDLDAVEAHGTGTPLGDPIELGALAAVHAGRSRPLVVGALKSRIGHLETAAGVAGMVRALIALEHGELGGDLHLDRPSPRIPEAAFAFPGRGGPAGRLRTVGVSSFGISGTDAHVILGVVDPRAEPPPADSPRGAPILLSAASRDALLLLGERVAEALRGADPAERDRVAATLAHGRAHLPWRAAWPGEPVRAARGLRVRADAGLVALGVRSVDADADAEVVAAAGPDPRRTAAELWARGADVDLVALVGPRTVTDAPTTPFVRRRAWVDLPTGNPVSAHVIAWVEGIPGGPADPRAPVPVASVLELLEANRRGATVFAADGVFEGTDPGRAAIAGAFASLLAEHPDRDLRLLDAVPDVAAALRTGSSRVLGTRVPSIAPAPAAPPLLPRGTWIVSGAGGALGGHVAAWLRSQGCTVVDFSRTAGVDVADARAVRRAVEALGPVGGVFHCAGVARGCLGLREDAVGLASVWGAKVEGARNLSEAAGDAPFVVASSAIAWFGLPGQAAYGAANAAAEAVVRERVARGRPGLAVRFGPFTVGMAEGTDWAARGVRPMSPARGLAGLGGDGVRLVMDGLPTDPRPVAVAPRPVAELLELVRRTVGEVLGRAGVDPRIGFSDAGIDSLGAVEVSRRLGRALGRSLPATLLFEHGTPEALARALAGPAPAPVVAARAIPGDDAVAIVGMGLRFPGVSSPEDLWGLLERGQVAIGPVPVDRWDAEAWYTPFPGAPGRAYVREGGFLEDPYAFDPEAFGLSPREAASLDPQQRVLLEVSAEALERAGHAGPSLRESRTGVFVGIADRGWHHRARRVGDPLYPDAWAGTGSEPSFAAGRLAFALGVHGPALALNTTCSSTLVAVHLAAAALRRGECDRALAGGVAMQHLPDDTAYLCALQALSPTHRCHVFDARADGYVRSEGCGVFVLVRLRDALANGDTVLGVLRGSAVNHDGPSSGLTVPNGAAQEAVLREALAAADLRPDAVGYVEAHGTGTRLGDPVETRALSAVYGARGSAAPLAVGAVKANLGHAELAAGAASLAKALLVLQHRRVPAQPDLREPNPDLETAGLRIARTGLALPELRAVGVSGFGLSGTNAHLVLEAGPAPAPPVEPPVGGPPIAILPLSASTATALVAWGRRLATVPADRADLAVALAGRAPHRVRAAVVGRDRLDRVTARVAGNPVLAFAISGQGSQWAGMGLALDAHPASRAALDACARTLDPLLGRPLRELLADPAVIDLTEFTQPLLFATAWATAALLRACRVEPAALAGHSLGELVAAALAGTWTLEDALRIVVARGRGMAERALPGAMAAIGTARVELAPGAEIAAWNAPDELVVAGPAEAVEATLAGLSRDVRVTRLSVSRPFHSACVEPMLDGYEAAVAAVPTLPPTARVVSLATGRVESERLRDPSFWRAHARDPVRVGDAAAALRALGVDLVVDLGPSPTLAGLLRRNDPALVGIPTSRRDADPWETLGRALAELWERGVDVDFAAFHGPRRRVALPPTPLDRRPIGVPEPAVELPPTFELVWEPVAERVVAPAVRVLGEGGPPSDPGASTTLDLRLRGLADLPKLADIGGERWIVVLRGDEPDVWALRAAVRSARLERPGTRVDLRLVEDLGALGLDVPGDEIRMHATTALAPRLAPSPIAGPPGSFGGRWWVTGGTGALGERFAAMLRERGAAEVVRIARTPGPGVEALDIADPDAVRALAHRLPPDGVIHAAGVTSPQALDALDPDTVAATLRAKVDGARALDAAIGSAPLLLVGSIAAVWGSRDLVAYAAANGFLEGLARARSAAGKPTACLAFGPWAGGGMVDDARAAELARAGLALLGPRGTLEVVARAFTGPPSRVVVRADWARLVPSLEVAGPQSLFRGLVAPVAVVAASAPDQPLAVRIRRHARAVLAFPPDRPLGDDQPLAELGFDSLMATELKAKLLVEGVDLPLGRILSGPSVAELVEMAEARAPRPAAAEPEAAVAVPADAPDPILWWTHLAAVLVGVGLASALWAAWAL